MRATTADFRSFINDLIRDNFIPDTTCTFTMLGIDDSIDICSTIDINGIQIAKDRDMVLVMSHDTTINLTYDHIDMDDVTDDMTYESGGQTWQWRFITGDNSYAALTFEIAA